MTRGDSTPQINPSARLRGKARARRPSQWLGTRPAGRSRSIRVGAGEPGASSRLRAAGLRAGRRVLRHWGTARAFVRVRSRHRAGSESLGSRVAVIRPAPRPCQPRRWASLPPMAPSPSLDMNRNGSESHPRASVRSPSRGRPPPFKFKFNLVLP